MNIIAAYQEVGTYRGAADICGTTHKTARRVIERSEAGEAAAPGAGGAAAELRRGGRVGRQAGQGLERADLGEAVVADRSGRRLRGVGAANTHFWALFLTDRFSVHPVAMSVTVNV
jgi:hypothetical protein